ncbi:MAG: hypothetical protein U9Q18_01985 [Caldisericota bacterium]|nr:hypothetical protein [Caldisericota bacterium]
MWLEVIYRPTTLFSLKQSRATSSGAKSLLTPSPYAAKMALLNAIITYDSLQLAIDNFDLIKELDMRFSLPGRLVVNNCFLKIQKEPHSETKKEHPEINFQSTVGFREYVYFAGDIKIAVIIRNEKAKDLLKQWLPRINYFGKKGCFFQFVKFKDSTTLGKEYSELLDDRFTNLSPGLIVEMDDFDETVTFDNVNTYSPAKTKRKKKFYILPIKIERANKNFTSYVSI